ncbi:hypothetical protein JOM56_015296 [Amanita muscaria]
MPPVFYSDAQTIIVSLGVGNLINWLLHGVLTVQVYLYYLAFPNDRKWTKAAVYTVYILETIQVIGLGIALLMIAATVSGDPEAVPSFYWAMNAASWFAQALLTTLVGSLVPLIAQSIYAHRIRIITRRKVMPGLIITLAILQLFAAVAITVTPPYRSVITIAVWAGLNVVNDLIIAFIMVRSLWKNKALSGYTRSRVIRLIHLVIATGSLTVAANLICLFSLLAFRFPSNLIFDYPLNSWKGDLIATPVLFFMPKLYANSILVMLNNRMAIKDSRNATPNMMSTNVVSTLVIGDHQIGPSGSAMSREEIPFSSSAITSAI